MLMVLPSATTTNIHTGYTMNSRAIEEMHVYGSIQWHGEDPKATLAERWSRPCDKKTATCLLKMEERGQVPRSRPMTFEPAVEGVAGAGSPAYA